MTTEANAIRVMTAWEELTEALADAGEHEEAGIMSDLETIYSVGMLSAVGPAIRGTAAQVRDALLGE